MAHDDFCLETDYTTSSSLLHDTDPDRESKWDHTYHSFDRVGHYTRLHVACAFVLGAALAVLFLGTIFAFPSLPQASSDLAMPSRIRPYTEATHSLLDSVEPDLAELVANVRWIDELIAASQASFAQTISQAGVSLALCAVVKGDFESDFVLEWILYHYLIGFQHVYIYENVDKPGDNNTGPPYFLQQELGAASKLASSLAPLIRSDFITFKVIAGEHYSSQNLQVHDCWQQHGKPRPARWVADLDIDEFLVYLPLLSRIPSTWLADYRRNHYPLRDYLESFLSRNESVVYMDRMDFSAWPHEDFITPDALVLESFVYEMFKREDSFGPKSVGFAAHVDAEQSNGHAAALNSALEFHHATTPCHHRWPRYAPFPPGTQCLEPMRVHHYISRSYADCMKKLADKTDKTKKANKVFIQEYWRVQTGVGACISFYNESEIIRNDVFQSSGRERNSVTILNVIKRMRHLFLQGRLVL